MTLKSDHFLFEKWHEKSSNFNSDSEKSENLHFDWIFLSKVCNVWAKIIYTDELYREKWLIVSKMT